MDFSGLSHALRYQAATASATSRLLWTWGGLGLLSAAALAAIAIAGPVSLGTLRFSWLVVFGGGIAILTAWFVAYSWLFRMISESSGADYGQRLWPFLLLSVSALPGAAVALSGKLNYTIVFDEDTFRAFRYLTALIFGTTLAVQEVALLAESYGGLRPLVRRAAGGIRSAPGQLERSVRMLARPSIPKVILLIILVAGSALRIGSIDNYHGGDMDVMLSITYNLLGWPLVAYYHNYVAQTWVYNHFPFFPIVLAPFYWLSENVLHFPTIWTAKLLIGVADVVIAILLFGIGRGSWARAWGVVFAAAWFLSPLVIRADDHPIAFAIAFSLLALASLDRPWLCGLMLALGVASRNEVAFLALPLLVHFAWRRPIKEAIAFFLVSGTVLGLITLPFILFDPAAMDYALRGQLQRDASSVQSMLFGALQPYMAGGMSEFVRLNPSLPALVCTGFTALLALRELRVERVVLLVALVYLVTLPLLYDRYLLFSFAVVLYYSARYSRPLPALAMGVLTAWPDFPYGSQLILGLLALLVVVMVARPVRSDDGEDTHPIWRFGQVI